jgi:hypothetical protein
MKIKKGQFLKYTTHDNEIFIVLVNEVCETNHNYIGTVVLSDHSYHTVGKISPGWRTDIEQMEREGLNIEIIEINEES